MQSNKCTQGSHCILKIVRLVKQRMEKINIINVVILLKAQTFIYIDISVYLENQSIPYQNTNGMFTK